MALSLTWGGRADTNVAFSEFLETWHHVAVVRSGSTCTIYLDGASKGSLTLAASNNPSGVIRLGRSDEIHQQFYGFIDDVAVFTSALSASQVAALAAAHHRRLAADARAGVLGSRVGVRRPARPVRRALAAGLTAESLRPLRRIDTMRTPMRNVTVISLLSLRPNSKAQRCCRRPDYKFSIVSTLPAAIRSPAEDRHDAVSP